VQPLTRSRRSLMGRATETRSHGDKVLPFLLRVSVSPWLVRGHRPAA
jgi:hypothetical protein